MSCSENNKENIPPNKRRIPWFRHHNPGTRYTYDGPRKPKVQVLSTVTVVPPKSFPRRPTTLPEPRPVVAPVTPPRRPNPAPKIHATPRRPHYTVPLADTPRQAGHAGVPRRLNPRPQPVHSRAPNRSKPRDKPRTMAWHPHPLSGRPRSPSRRPRLPYERSKSPKPRKRDRTPAKPRFRPPPPRSPSPPKRIVITRDRGMRPDIPWMAPRKLNLMKPSRPRFHDSTGRDPRSRGVQVVVTLPPPDTPVRRSATPPTPRMSPVSSPIRPLPPTPPSIKVPGPPARSKIVYYRGSLVPGRPRRHISLAYYPREDA